MLVIRLARTGRSKYPTYRIVAADSARATTGRFVAQLGHYNPHTKELVVRRDEVSKYLSTGAQPSNTVVKLLQREGVELPAWVKLKTKTAKPKHEAPTQEETPADEIVTEAEAAEDAAESDTPAPEEERVATVAEDAAVAIEDEAPTVDETETAASEEAEAEVAEKAEDASDEVATAE